MKLTPCIETFFTALPFPERIREVRKAGFDACEFWVPEGKDLTAIVGACRETQVVITSIAGPALEPYVTDASRLSEVLASLKTAVEAAKALSCDKIIVLSGNVIVGMTREKQCRLLADALRHMAPVAEKAGVTLVLEVLNSLYDHPGYFLDNIAEMAAILRSVDHPSVKGLVDIYHSGIMEGNLIEKIRDNIDIIAHFHAAGIPGRHEMIDGEQNYPAICRSIEKAGYTGYLGLEYFPLKDPAQSLVETRKWLNGN